MARGSHISIDGKSSVDQGEYFPHQSKGSHTSRADLDACFNWWRIREMHPDPCPRDLNGVPHVLCSNGHYSPVAAFKKDPTRPNGLCAYCKQCKADKDRERADQEAAVQGRMVRHRNSPQTA